jgi:predicted GIY-YIG superfamily endonuclease/transposase-like protein
MYMSILSDTDSFQDSVRQDGLSHCVYVCRICVLLFDCRIHTEEMNSIGKNGFVSSKRVRFPTVKMESLYVLQLEDNKWYVGKTADIATRFKQHASGKGSAWTKSYNPVKIVETRRLKDQYDENNTTKEYMKKYGIDNVRGGSYTQVVLPEDVEKVLKLELRGDTNTCFKCNLKGHFAGRCPNVSTKKTYVAPMEEVWECADCHRTFTTEYGCRVHQRSCNPAPVEEEWECADCHRTFTTEYGCRVHQRSCNPPPKKQGGSCYRCGRQGHYSPDCYANTHVKGYELD